MEQGTKKSKLKIIIPVVVAIVIIAVVIVIIPKGKMSKEKMLAVANDIKLEDFESEIKSNQTRAKEKYINNCYIITGYIQDFQDNSIIIYDSDNYYSDTHRTKIKANLLKKDIKLLDKNQKVTIVGKISNIDFSKEDSIVGGARFDYDVANIEMKNAYINKDIFEITGVVDVSDEYKLVSSYSGKIGKTKRELKEWYCHIGDYDITEFAETKNFVNDRVEKNIVFGTEITDGNSVTITGKVFNITSNNAKYQIKDLKSIKVNAEN